MEHNLAMCLSRKEASSKGGGDSECNCQMNSLWVNLAQEEQGLMKSQEDARKMMCLHDVQSSGQLQKTPRGFMEIK